MAHFIERCECGRVINQCRCMGPKEERIISPCNHQPTTTTTAAATPPGEAAAAKANGFKRKERRTRGSR